MNEQRIMCLLGKVGDKMNYGRVFDKSYESNGREYEYLKSLLMLTTAYPTTQSKKMKIALENKVSIKKTVQKHQGT